MSDHWASPPAGLGYAGDARRERPLEAAEGIGPWHASVTVTPIIGGGPETLFEVAVQWTGPPLAIEPRDHDAYAPSPSWTGPAVLANDCYYTPDQALARQIAYLAGRALERPQRPDLRGYARDPEHAE